MANNIEKWQLSLPPGDDEAESAHYQLVTRLCTEGCKFYQAILHHLQGSLPKTLYRKIEQPYSHLLLWADGYGARTGELDAILSDSKKLRRSTVDLLVSICQTLTKRLLPLVQGLKEPSSTIDGPKLDDLAESAAFLVQDEEASDSDSDSDSSTANPTKESIGDVAEDLSLDVQCLIDLGPRFEEPVRDSWNTEKVAPAPSSLSWNPAEYLASRIRYWYPDGNDELISSLGRLNWARMERLQAAKKQKSNLERSKDDLKTLLATEYHDSGIGTSVSASSSYAETVMSYHGSKGSLIKIPPLPEGAAWEEPFECFICGETIRISNTKGWKKHVLADLQPYVCLETACKFSSTPFADQKLWVEHLALDHDYASGWDSVECPLCHKETGAGKMATTSHLARHLEEISLTILPTNIDPGNDEDSDGDDAAPLVTPSPSMGIRGLTAGVETTERGEENSAKQNLDIESVDKYRKGPHISPPAEALASTSSQPTEPQSTCTICGYRPKGDPQWFRGSMAKHMKLQHSTAPPKIYQCPFPGCNTAYKNRPDNLRQHQIEKGHFVEEPSRWRKPRSMTNRPLS